MDKRQEAKGRAAFARIWAIVGCLKTAIAQLSATQHPASPQPGACKRPGEIPSGPFTCILPTVPLPALPVRRTSPQAHGFHHNPLWRRSEKRAHPDSRLFQIPDWRAENGDSVVHPPSRFYPFGTSQPSHASGRTRVKSSQSVALLSSSVKTYARTSVKPVSPIKCPYTACPSRIAAKETPYPGRVISCGPPSSATKLPAQKANASLTQCSSLVRTYGASILLGIPASRSRLGPHGTQKRRSRKNASSASTAPSRAATALPAIRQPERNTANGRLPAFRKCPPDLPSPATPARGGC